MIKLITILPFFLLTCIAMGQVEIKWSEPQDFHIKYLSQQSPVISGGSNENYVVQSYSGLKRYYSTWSGTKKVAELEESFNGKLFSEYVEPINYFYLGEQLIRINRIYIDNAWKVVFEKKSSSFSSEEKPVEIAEITKKEDWHSSLYTYQSKNQNFLVIYWQYGTSDENDMSLGYVTLNKNLSVHSSGKFKIPFNAQNARMNKLYLSDQGDLFALFSEYSVKVHPVKLMSGNRHFNKEIPDFQKMYACRIEGNSTITVVVDLSNKRLQDMALYSKEKNELSIVSTYGEKGVRWQDDFSNGFTHVSIDFNQKKIVDEKYLSFSKESIQNNASLTIKPKLEEGQTGVKLLFMKEVFFLDNGKIVGSAEHSEFWPVSQPAGSQNIPGHKSRNILAFSFDTNDESKNWIKEVEKGQVALSSTYCKTSYKSFVRDNEIHFLFLDMTGNYDTNRSFDEARELDWIQIGKKSTRDEQIVADAVVNIENGSILKREILIDNLGESFLPLPKSFYIDKDGKIGMVAIDSKTKSILFGVLKWN